MHKIEINPQIAALPTEVFIGEGLLKSFFLKNFCTHLKGKIIIVADPLVKNLYALDLATELGAKILTIPSGEQAKGSKTCQFLLDELFKMGADRDTTLIALGGGVTTDLVGFIASIYMRGLALILVPTTLLGIVDAAIGGKTAIDTPFGKNLIGTIYPPKAIFADLDTLKTLSEKEKLNGLAEILKMGLIYDASIWETAQKNTQDPDLLLKAIQGKIEIVQQDPLERSLRRILNFGHTIGHALETISGYEIPHGEAVALGCCIEAYLSMQLNYFSPKEFEQIQTMYSCFPLKLPSTYTRTNFIHALSFDKKKVLGKIRFVLLDKIGKVVPFENTYCRAVDPHELESTLDWMENRFLR